MVVVICVVLSCVPPPATSDDQPNELRPAARKGWFDPPPQPDLDSATAHNARGVELMDNLEFTEARLEFAAAVRAAPDWLPARINYAIASFNEQSPDSKELDAQLENAQRVFRNVLVRDPGNRHAHYCLGVIDLYVGKYADAHSHFQRVRELDPEDAFTWLRMGTTHPDGMDSPAAGVCFEKALGLDPKLNEARYRLARIAIEERDDQRTAELLTEYKRLQDTDQATGSRIVFGEMGKYADVIGRDPSKPGQPGGDPPGIKKRSPW